MEKRLEEIQNGILCNIVETENEIEQVSKGAANIVNFNLPDVTIGDPKTGKEICLISEKKKNIYLQEPFCLKEINCPKNGAWQRPYNISTGNDCVLICDFDKPYITCAYSSDKPTTTVPAVHGDVRDACVYQGYLYTAYQSIVTKRTYKKAT